MSLYKRKKHYRRSVALHVAENILNRKFTAEKLNEKWITDVIEFKYGLKESLFKRTS